MPPNHWLLHLNVYLLSDIGRKETNRDELVRGIVDRLKEIAGVLSALKQKPEVAEPQVMPRSDVPIMA